MSPRTPARRLTKEKVSLLRTGYLNAPMNIQHDAVSLSDSVVDALSLRCPNARCPYPFNLLPELMPDAWENCCAAKCPSCGICFCWFCFLIADPPDYATRHNHVSRCRHNPNENGDPFLRPASRIEPVHRQRRIEAVRRALARHNYSSDAVSRSGSRSGSAPSSAPSSATATASASAPSSAPSSASASASVIAAGEIAALTWLEAPAARAAVEAAAPRLLEKGISPKDIFVSAVTEAEIGEEERELFLPVEELLQGEGQEQEGQGQGPPDPAVYQQFGRMVFGPAGMRFEFGPWDENDDGGGEGGFQFGGMGMGMGMGFEEEGVDADVQAFVSAAGAGDVDIVQALLLSCRGAAASPREGRTGTGSTSESESGSVSGLDVDAWGAAEDAELGSELIRVKRGALHAAAAAGRSEVLRLLLLDGGAKADAKDSEGCSALHWASAQGHASAVEILIDEGNAPVDALDNQGKAPIHYACNEGQVAALEALLARASDVNLKRNDPSAGEANGWPPLVYAMQAPSLEVIVSTVSVLLAAPGLDVNLGDVTGINFLMSCAINAELELATLVLASPLVDINAVTNGGMTALLLGCMYAGRSQVRSHKEVIALLLSRPECSVNDKDDRGTTGLMLVASGSCTPSLQVLLQHPGVDVNARDNGGRCALYHAALKGRLDNVRELLLRDDVDKNLQCNAGNSPLIVAATAIDTPAVFRAIAEHPSVDINAGAMYGDTAGHIAAQQGNTDAVRTLLASLKGYDVNAQTQLGKTALHDAALTGRADVVDILLAAPGIDVNLEDNGTPPSRMFAQMPPATPLVLASTAGYAKCVISLLAAPTLELHHKDQGRSALSAAQARGHGAVVAALTEALAGAVRTTDVIW